MAACVWCVLASGCGSGISAGPSEFHLSAPVAGAPAGPVLGYVWRDSDKTLQPLLGVVGSAVVGPSVVAAGTYVAGAASSVSDVGVVEDANRTLYTLALPSAKATWVADGAPDSTVSPVQIAMAPQGRAAIAYTAGGNHVMVVAGLGGTAKATTYTMPAGSTVAAAAVSDAGTVLVESGAGPLAVGVLSAAGVQRISTVAQAGGMSFLPGADDAVVADGGRSTAALLHHVSGTATVQALNATGVNGPVALSVTRDARWAVIANRGDSTVAFLDLQNGDAAVKTACACKPTGVHPLSGGRAFRLNDLNSGPVWIADLSAASPQLVFVPAVH